MKFGAQIEAFINDYVRELEGGSAAVFCGAGMSKASGYVDWPDLLREIADGLGLSVDQEHDLISLAQYHVNDRLGSNAALAKKILQEFSDQAQPSEAHSILARLPIGTYWTTNYDNLVETSLQSAFKTVDVKHTVKQLVTTRPKRDAVVYKMHGDVTAPQDAILHKQQYEQYHITHSRFVTALSGDLVSKTFLFIGFSFTDPNLDYVLSRLHVGEGVRDHYCFVRREKPKPGEHADITKYNSRKQELRTKDLKRFGIQALIIDEFNEIPEILREVESRFLKKTVFVSGSAEEFGAWERSDAQTLIHQIAADIVKAELRIVNGFGWGVGSSVINGALESIYASPTKYSEDQLILRPFPQVGENLPALWQQYRQRMISLAGVALFLFGNKLDNGKVVNASGVEKEFDICVERGVVPLPIGCTGYMSKVLADRVLAAPEKYFQHREWLPPLLAELNAAPLPIPDIAERVTTILKRVGK